MKGASLDFKRALVSVLKGIYYKSIGRLFEGSSGIWSDKSIKYEKKPL